MGWLSDLLGAKPTKYVQLEGDGDFECEVVGESHHQGALNAIAGGKTSDGHEYPCQALLLAEPNNPKDRNAIVVTVNGHKVGYLNRQHAAVMSKIFKKHKLAGAYAEAVIVGGWKREGRQRQSEGHYGVKLDIPV
jgi:hypothetical protein